MRNSFDVSIFIKNLGDDLITIFDRSSNLSIHPDEAGKAKEINIAKQIESLLPHGIGVGRGFVFDSKGNISNQCDLIVYEKNLVPVFVMNSNDEYSYYPCEGVIAVGEIKSTLNKSELTAALEKLNKIKKMERIVSDPNVYRCYFHSFTTYGANSERFDPIEKSFDNIFTFIFCRDNCISIETILDVLICEYSECMEIGIDKIYSLNKPIISRFTFHNNQNFLWGEKKGIGFSSLKIDADYLPFGILINDISLFIQNGRSQKFCLENYYNIGTMSLDAKRTIYDDVNLKK